MGRAGIRRRKPYKRLPRPDVRDQSDTPPNIMWPTDAAFEASTLSPAGRSELSWRFLRNLTHPRRRGHRIARALAIGAVAWLAFVVVFTLAQSLR